LDECCDPLNRQTIKALLRDFAVALNFLTELLAFLTHGSPLLDQAGAQHSLSSMDAGHGTMIA
jgi:hypothetical protein